MAEVVDKEVNKVVEEVNKKLVKLVDLLKVIELIINLMVVMEMIWCWTRRLTWRSTMRLIRK